MTPPITNALLSVSDKTGITDFAASLAAMGIGIISTGGTAKILRDSGIDCRSVADITGMAEMMDGRVKTLHPRIHGGILARRDNSEDLAAMQREAIPPIDLVVVNLYPFEAALGNPSLSRDEMVENIDIGGPAMIRAAAKNHGFVAAITNPLDYGDIAAEIKTSGGLAAQTRRRLAAQAFAHTAHYDSVIAQWLRADNNDPSFPEYLSFSGRHIADMRYGENPHQQAALYQIPSQSKVCGVLTASQHQGKPLSFNNINDTDAAFELVSEFADPTVVIVKHANPCGVASGGDLAMAWDAALACDQTSAFGGIVAVNRALTAEIAEKITAIFTEVVIAPNADEAAKAIFANKPRLRLLLTGGLAKPAEGFNIRSVAGGFLVQSRDDITPSVMKGDMTCVTKRQPTPQQWDDMIFAMTVAKHVKSNAIVYAKDRATVGIGAGQMSRIDSSRIAAAKAADSFTGEGASPIIGSAVASDAFFPFADGLLAAAEAGAKAVIQPGGSINDKDVIAAADDAGLAMVFTGTRHFRH